MSSSNKERDYGNNHEMQNFGFASSYGYDDNLNANTVNFNYPCTSNADCHKTNSSDNQDWNNAIYEVEYSNNERNSNLNRYERHPSTAYSYQDPDLPGDEDYSDTLSRWQMGDRLQLIARQHRTTSIHRNAFKEPFENATIRTLPTTLENRRKWMSNKEHAVTHASSEQRACSIANRMEQDDSLMENSPESELLRREALRDMPQNLTVKRIIKKRLTTTVSRHSKRKPLGCFKNLKYTTSMKLSKLKSSLKSLVYSVELWYSSLKIIEGHFGSGVALHFKFFRWLFVMNLLIAFFTLLFVVLPQLLYVNVVPVYFEGNATTAAVSNDVVETHAPFEFKNILTGEGYFTNTTLYYGFYTQKTINIINNQKYSMPYAYFFTMFCLYIVCFIVLSTSMARSYRRSFIETQGGLKNIYAHKIFCGWDYSIATQEAADLKASSIYNELKELLGDSVKYSRKVSFLQSFYTRVIQVVCNIVIMLLLFGTGYVMWKLLNQHHSENTDDKETLENKAIITAIIINIIILCFPILFSFIVKYEDYKHPRASLYITLIRTFLLKTVVVGVFIGFWLTHFQNETCWETSIGQHIYRLILFDFLFSVLLAALVETVRFIIYKRMWKRIGAPKFDIARYTLQLMYNQTLFWVGFYFAPLLTVVVVLKLWCTWYIRRTFVLYLCQPSSKSWRAAQTHTLFLILSFLSLLFVLFTHGYIIVGVATSNCGPLRDYNYMYEMILKGIFQLEQNNSFWKILMYLTKPGTVALILIAMCVVVYYLRAKAVAQRDMVNILRGMLVLEAKDKEFLLETISKVTGGQWQYNLQNHTDAWNASDHGFVPMGKQSTYEEDLGEENIIGETGSSTENIRDYSYPYTTYPSSSKDLLDDSVTRRRKY